MARVRIVYMPTPDRRGPDLDRIGTVEDVPDELARAWVADGSATWADDDSDGQATAAAQPAPAQPQGATPATMAAAEESSNRTDLASMTKAELLAEAEARGVQVPSSATKADIVEALLAAESTAASQ